MPLNVALNERKNTFKVQGEFKNGALFIDLDDFYRDNLLRLMAAEETIVQMPSADRLNVLQRTRTPDGKGDIAGFVGEMWRRSAKRSTAARSAAWRRPRCSSAA